ncbi:hypothetical protein [Methanotorris formicicus]|uniref:DUF155 domain-containing protein n=1 Tax=Methanotorris formicicus Mc-S-70 TaxID=647171 RepID=H1KWD9_9EURY|nr:hypothetical protein [Methanotorris formicicus]EHP89516.1 hypothetical protein MetfoDRAFT_0112 [Methanotorris formicicus Mc-S-70]
MIYLPNRSFQRQRVVRIKNSSDSFTNKLSGKIVQILVGRLKKGIDSGQIMSLRTKKTLSYEEFLPTYSLLERITEENKEIIVKVYEMNIIVEITKEFRNKELLDIFELKEELCCEAEDHVKKYNIEKFLESYTVFCFSDYDNPDEFVQNNKKILGRLLRGQYEDVPEEYIEELLENKLKYSDKDLIILDWDNGVILDKNEDFWEEVDIVELACVRVLNLRVFDYILSERIKYLLQLELNKLGYFRLRKVSKEVYAQRISYISYLDAVESVLILYGDRYYAELYETLCEIFYVPDWIKRVEKKLEMINDIYSILKEHMVEYYNLILEGTIVALIFIEIIFALL